VLLPVGQSDATAATQSVCLDPGHGGTDPGTSNGGIRESDLNLDVANRLASLLVAGGYQVYQTRTGDQTLSNKDRYTFCNSKQATILVSIHHNGSSDPTVDYSLGLYMKKTDVPLATALVGAVSSGLGTPNAGVRRFASGVLLKSKMPAAISEGFFLTSTYEYNRLTQGPDDRRQAEAQALYAGIETYFAQQR
jgi:N-acetylmuramoyl-L-alanine amidase